MFAKKYSSLLVFALLGVLAGCSPASPIDAVAPSLPQVEASPPPPSPTVDAQSSSASPGSDCQNVQEIPMEECEGLVALYENTNGDAWQDNPGWLADDTPCDWIGVTCQQGHVTELQLAHNELTGSLPAQIGNLIHLQQLYLEGNQLSGPVPAEIGKLTELWVLRLSGNQFNSLPAELSNLRNLFELDLSRNQFGGSIPSDLSNLTLLSYLGMNTNQFTGEIPSELGTLTNLTHLDLANNQLSGSIPASLGNLAVLNELHLSHNQLTGSIPTELSNLMGLYSLDLSYNQLTGEVPQALKGAPIADVRLWGNQLDGTIFSSDQAVTSLDFQGVHFEYDSDLAESIWTETVPAEEGTPDAPGWLVWPEHVRFTFASAKRFGIPRAGSVGPFVHPQIMVFPTDRLGTMSEFARQEIMNLQVMLEGHRPAPEGPLPLLPMINAAQVFHAQVEYLDFQNGSGVRYITQYSQDVFPIINQSVFYTFQGLTEDGSYYVAAAFPINAEGLPDRSVIDEWDMDDWETFSAGHQDYLKETAGQLDALSTDEFEPDLALLDRVIQSLMVSAP